MFGEGLGVCLGRDWAVFGEGLDQCLGRDLASVWGGTGPVFGEDWTGVWRRGWIIAYRYWVRGVVGTFIDVNTLIVALLESDRHCSTDTQSVQKLMFMDRKQDFDYIVFSSGCPWLSLGGGPWGGGPSLTT